MLGTSMTVDRKGIAFVNLADDGRRSIWRLFQRILASYYDTLIKPLLPAVYVQGNR
jgi:hypothetical protein